MNDKDIIRDLGDGLILRPGKAEDAEALAKFNGEIHADEDEDVAEHIAAWAHDLATKAHPTFEVGLYTIVEDTKSGEIVSSLNLIPQTWSYAGIEFGVGRPELVGTKPEYRRRGLVRAQMETIHLWSAAMGHKVQAITGIPWYYRMFGYEMALNLGGGRRGYPTNIPKLKDGEKERYSFRPAEESDLGFISQLYEESLKRSLIGCVRDQAFWQYELSGRSEKNAHRQELRVIEKEGGEAAGFLAYPGEPWESAVEISYCEVKQGISWLEVSHSLLRYLILVGEEMRAKDGKKQIDSIYFNLGEQHPIFEVIPDWLPRVHKPYAWYIRVADMAGFVQMIVPVLEARLAESPFAGHSGEVKISFYKEGLRLHFEEGKIQVEAWQPKDNEDGMLFFPDLTFNQLLFGYRDFDELVLAFADCFCKRKHPEVPGLIRTLFPKQASNVWGIA